MRAQEIDGLLEAISLAITTALAAAPTENDVRTREAAKAAFHALDILRDELMRGTP